jgi:hypothetical protein
VPRELHIVLGIEDGGDDLLPPEPQEYALAISLSVEHPPLENVRRRIAVSMGIAQGVHEAGERHAANEHRSPPVMKRAVGHGIPFRTTELDLLDHQVAAHDRGAYGGAIWFEVGGEQSGRSRPRRASALFT